MLFMLVPQFFVVVVFGKHIGTSRLGYISRRKIGVREMWCLFCRLVLWVWTWRVMNVWMKKVWRHRRHSANGRQRNQMEGEKRDTTGEGTELGRGVW